MQVDIDLGNRSYPVIIGTDLLEKSSVLLAPYITGKSVCVVTNEVVASLFLKTLKSQLSEKFDLSEVILPDGEEFKNLTTLNKIFDVLLENKQSRDVTLIALGGGVVGDMTGFAAASFMRGVNFIQIPTTLLAQVDSSVGGKTGVNHALGKNMIGAFYQPRCVLADVSFLQTLPARELSAGLAEVIKYGLIADKEFFGWLQENIKKLTEGDEGTLSYAIKISCECKARIVSADETEQGLRAILNLGHTFGHAIEAHYQFQNILHGEAVAIGTCMAAHLSHDLGLINETTVEDIKKLFIAANLPISTREKISSATLYEYMKVDKKVKSGQMRLIVLNAIGEAKVIAGIPQEKIIKAIERAMP